MSESESESESASASERESESDSASESESERESESESESESAPSRTVSRLPKRDTVRAPFNNTSGRNCMKSLRPCLRGTCPQSQAHASEGSHFRLIDGCITQL